MAELSGYQQPNPYRSAIPESIQDADFDAPESHRAADVPFGLSRERQESIQ
jgi:hypothetical protein